MNRSTSINIARARSSSMLPIGIHSCGLRIWLEDSSRRARRPKAMERAKGIEPSRIQLGSQTLTPGSSTVFPTNRNQTRPWISNEISGCRNAFEAVAAEVAQVASLPWVVLAKTTKSARRTAAGLRCSKRCPAAARRSPIPGRNGRTQGRQCCHARRVALFASESIA